MPRRIVGACRASGRQIPDGRPELVRCIVDSLAAACARAVEQAVLLSGQDVDVVHLVGGGARNELLRRLTERSTGRPVIAGPAEATALGNALVQARAVGTLTGGLEDLRQLVNRADAADASSAGETVGGCSVS